MTGSTKRRVLPRCATATLALAMLNAVPLAAQQQASRTHSATRDSAHSNATPRDTTPPSADSAIISRHDSVSIRLIDADIRAAVQALAPYLDRPVVFGAMSAAHVTLQTPAPVPRRDVVTLLKGVLESQNFELVADSGLYRVQQKAAPRPVAASQTKQRGDTVQGPVELYVIRVKHARAADVAATVNALFGRASALGEVGDPPSTLSEQLQQTQLPPPTRAPPSQAVPGVAGKAASFTGEVTIVPDARSNSLLIRANPSDFALIDAAVKELDVRPLQVLIEVLIAEVRRDRSFSFGLGGVLDATKVPGGNATVDGTQGGLGLGDLVLHIMTLGSTQLEATLAAAAAHGDVSIMSRPVLIAANNESATINVGSQRPFVQVSRSLPTDVATRDQVVQYKDVGTKLTVHPTISADGYVMLEVTQEVNNATSETQFDAPIISTRSVQTQLLIKDGQTIVLGGLRDKQSDVNSGGIPILSSIPLLGGLFGHTSHQTTQTELMLFITPHVIRTDVAADSLTIPLKKRAEGRQS